MLGVLSGFTRAMVFCGMRIGTWNVQYAAGQEKNARRRAVLDRHACDIWILTETHDDLDLSETHTALHSVQRPTGRVGSRWTSIWTRLPVVRSLKVVDARRTVAVVLDAPMGPLIVYGSVMPWADDRGDTLPEVKVRNWSEHHRVIVQQGEEWTALRRAYPDADLCVAGDLNMNLGGKHRYGTAKGRGLLRESMEGCALFCATETDRLPLGVLGHSPIDHILLPVSWATRTVIAAAWEGRTSDGVRLSDHSGLAVEVGSDRLS